MVMDWDSSVGMGSRYGLGGPRIKSREGEGAWFSRTCPDGPSGPPNPLYSGHVSFPGVKRPGCGVKHLLWSSAEVKERIQLYRSTSAQGFNGLFLGELCLYLRLYRLKVKNVIKWHCYVFT
jgi:hypothetical protein